MIYKKTKLRIQAHCQVARKSLSHNPKLVNKLACPNLEKKAQLPTKNILHAAIGCKYKV